MKKLTTLLLSLVLSHSLAVAQSDKSDAYEVGYYVGYYGAILLPFIFVAAVVYIVYRIVKRRRQVKA